MQSRSLHCYEYLDRPYDKVRLVFAGETIDVLEHATGKAAERAVALSTTLSVPLGSLTIGADITVKIHGFEQSNDPEHPSSRLRITWEANHRASVFPAMEADLEAHPVTDTETQLALFGVYRPPLGALGRAADALAGHRIAEASVHRFLREVVERLRLIIPGESAGADESD